MNSTIILVNIGTELRTAFSPVESQSSVRAQRHLLTDMKSSFFMLFAYVNSMRYVRCERRCDHEMNECRMTTRIVSMGFTEMNGKKKQLKRNKIADSTDKHMK